ncbi:MAG: hypothetical protein CM1200mP39_00760 [Dehalococcoidia bacterium]|nr:MAG: hypothetical protein CM1200mP39_00760 [Dehalococcoidia bacterium]
MEIILTAVLVALVAVVVGSGLGFQLPQHPFGKITASRRRGICATNAQIQRSQQGDSS